jgi:hypothetical protein
MAQVQDAVHVRIGKIAEKLLFRCAFSRRIHLEYFGISPLGLRRHGWRGIVRSKEGEGCGGTTGVKYTSLTDSRLLWQPACSSWHHLGVLLQLKQKIPPCKGVLQPKRGSVHWRWVLSFCEVDICKSSASNIRYCMVQRRASKS